MFLLAWLRHHYPALEHPPYARLLWATALSSLGSQFTVLALSVAVFSATGSVASLAGIWAVRVASRLLIQPFTGALADRWDRRQTLVGPVWLFIFDALTFAGVAYAVLGLPATLVTVPSRRGASVQPSGSQGPGPGRGMPALPE